MNGPVSSTISSPSRSGRCGGIAAHAQAISKQGDSSVKAQQSSPPERHAPDREEVAEASGAVEVNDARRRVRPLMRMTRRTTDADTRRDDDGEPVREQLEVHALRRDTGDGARSVHRRARLIPRARADRRRYQHLLEAIALVGLLAGCGGGGGSGAPTIAVGAAHTYALSGFEPAGPVAAGKPTRVSFTILQPDGKPLTQFKRGPGPHTGVHLIIVRRDLSTIVHEHPPVGANGRISATITFPEPGPYRVVIDVYPKTAGPVPNFQEFAAIRVAGAYTPKPLPPLETSQTVDGYTIHAARDAAAARDPAGVPRLHGDGAEREAGAVPRRGSARSRTRSSSAAGRSTTSTRTCARPARADARACSGPRA